MAIGNVEEVHGPGKIEVGIGVEAGHELLSLVVEIGLDLVQALAEMVSRVFYVPSESLVEFCGRAIGDHADLPGQGEPILREFLLAVASLPVAGVAQDRIALD